MSSNDDNSAGSVFVEKEDDVMFWQGTFEAAFVDKINVKFGTSYTVSSLLQKLGKSLISGNRDIVFDWLTPGDIQSMMVQSGRDQNDTNVSKSHDPRVLVMIETSGDNNINIPFALSAYSESNGHPASFNQPSAISAGFLTTVIKRLKSQRPNPSSREDTFFLTGANVQKQSGPSSETLAHLQQLKDENERLKRDLDKLSKDQQRETTQGNYRTESVIGKLEKEILSLKTVMAEYEIEMSVLPALKKQLRDKNKELEVMNLYAREVEICQKIRAPIPNLNRYKQSLMDGDDNGYGAKPVHLGNNPISDKRIVPGTVPFRSNGFRTGMPARTENRGQPTSGGIYAMNLSTGKASRSTSQSRLNSYYRPIFVER